MRKQTHNANTRQKTAKATNRSKRIKMTEATAEDRQKEVDKNLDFFLSELDSLSQTHFGKFALIRHRHITEFYDTAMDAFRAGNSLYPDRLFSIQQVNATPVDLGFFSHAGDMGKS